MLEIDKEFYKGLNFLPLTTSMLIYTNMHKTHHQHLQILIWARALDMGGSLSSEARLCKWRCGNQAKIRLCSIPVHICWLYHKYKRLLSKSWQLQKSDRTLNTISFFFFPWFYFPFYFYALRFALVSCTPQSTSEKEKKFSSYVSMFINKLLPQHFWLQEISNLTPLLGDNKWNSLFHMCRKS